MEVISCQLPCPFARIVRICWILTASGPIHLARLSGRHHAPRPTTPNKKRKGIPHMRRLILAALLATVFVPNAGCCIMDRLFHCGNKCSLFGGGCGSGDCGSGDCGSGDCGSGDCGSGDCGAGGCGAEAAPCDNCGGAPGGCASCADRHAANRADKDAALAAEFQGPLGPQVTYPYYTNRGPRDFLAKNPRDIGP